MAPFQEGWLVSSSRGPHARVSTCRRAEWGVALHEDKLASVRIATTSPSGGSDGKESTCNAGDPGSTPGWGRSGKGNSNPLQYSGRENPLARGAWWATVSAGTESRTRLNDFTDTYPTSGIRSNPFPLNPHFTDAENRGMELFSHTQGHTWLLGGTTGMNTQLGGKS